MTTVNEPAATVPDSIVPTRVTIGAGQSDAFVFHGNASTGYSWDSTVDPADSDCVLASWYLLPDPLRRMGGPDLEILVITGIRPGTATITVIYHRRWEPDTPPAKVHEIAVTVES